MERVFAGLRALHQSLERAGALEHFDFFVLSDVAKTLTRLAPDGKVKWTVPTPGRPRGRTQGRAPQARTR